MATWLTRYRVSVLCAVGGLVGSLVPVAVLTTLANAPAGAASVQVAPGQTLWQIAGTYGTTVSALAAANGIADPNLVLAGATLLIPSGSGAHSHGGHRPDDHDRRGRRGQPHRHRRPLWDDGGGARGSSTGSPTRTTSRPDPSCWSVGRQPAPAGGTATQTAASTGGGLPAQVLAHPDRVQLQPVFQQWAGTFGVPVSLLEAMCWWESGWQNGVVSSTGAVGIGQLEPYTVSSLRIRLGDPTLDPTVPSDNIEMSAALLHDLLVESGGSESVALASYYQGFASVSQSGMFASTSQYVQGIMSSVAGFS